MKIHLLQHVPFEGPGSIEAWAIANGHTLSSTRFYAQEQFPALDRFDVLVVLGGPMSIHDDHLYAWLKGEKWFVQQVIEAGKPVLGICLGAQLIAHVLGGSVYPGPQKEIGWFPLSVDTQAAAPVWGDDVSSQLTVFHWHGETFSLPPEAQRIASSAVCDNQGFIYRGRVIALQFHLETTPGSAQNLIEYCADELVNAPYIQSADTILEEQGHYRTINHYMSCTMDYLVHQAAIVSPHP